MQRTLALRVLLLVSMVIVAAAGVAVVAAESEYGMAVDGAIDTPTETIEIEGETYEIDEGGVADRGGTITVEVTAPARYNLYLYDTDVKAVHRAYTDDDRVEFDLDDDIEPGTYMLSLEPDGAGRQAVTPVVVQGYDISLEYPSTVTVDDDVTFTATVEPLAGQAQPDTVDLAVWDGKSATNVTLEQTAGTNYSTTESMARLGPGTYDVYGTVTGDVTRGYETAEAVTDGHTLTVTETEENETADRIDGDQQETDETDDGAGGTEDDPNAENESETTETPVTEGNTTDVTETDNQSDSDEPPANEAEESNETDAAESTSNVIEPNETDGTEPDEPEADNVGMPTAILSLIAVVALLVALGRGSR